MGYVSWCQGPRIVSMTVDDFRYYGFAIDLVFGGFSRMFGAARGRNI